MFLCGFGSIWKSAYVARGSFVCLHPSERWALFEICLTAACIALRNFLVLNLHQVDVAFFKPDSVYVPMSHGGLSKDVARVTLGFPFRTPTSRAWKRLASCNARSGQD